MKTILLYYKNWSVYRLANTIKHNHFLSKILWFLQDIFCGKTLLIYIYIYIYINVKWSRYRAGMRRMLLRSIRRTPSQLHSLHQIPKQHDMLPQNLVYKNELNREYVITFLNVLRCICWLIVEVILRNARSNDEIHRDYYICHVCPAICMSVLSSAWNSSAATGRIFMKFYILTFF